MSTHFVKFRCDSLITNGEFYILLPDKNMPEFFTKGNPHYNRPTKTIIMLHGYSADCTEWLYSAPTFELCGKYNLAIVMPAGGLSFYLDNKATGRKWCKFVGNDLIQYLRDTFGLAMRKEDTYIGGESMGGFGALHTGLAYPDNFNGIIALSSALIIHKLKYMKPDGPDAVMANYDYYVDIFNDLNKAEESDANPEVLYLRNKENGITNPRIFMACGSEDFLIESNREMAKFFEENKADYKYVEGPGVHNFEFWVPRFIEGLDYFLK